MTDDQDVPVFTIDARLEGVADGTVPAAELSSDEQALRHLMTAAAGPTLPEESAGKDRALTVFAYQVTGPVAVASGASWLRERSPRSGRRAGATAAAAVAAVMLSGVTAAAATGSLPPPLQHVVHKVVGAPDSAPSVSPTASYASSHTTNASDSTDSSSADPRDAESSGGKESKPSGSGSPTTHVAGLHAAGSAGGSAAGLCRAWDAHSVNVNPHSALARSLSHLAGGSDNVAAYCQTVLAEASGHPSPTSNANTSSHGNGNANSNNSVSASASSTTKSHPNKPGQAKTKPSSSNSSSHTGGSKAPPHP